MKDMNNILIDSDKIDTIIGHINDSSYKMNNGIGKSKNMFSSIQESGNLSSGVNTINNNLSFIADRFDSYKNIIVKQATSFFEQEKELASLVDKIEIPKELNTIDNIFETKNEEIELTKEDGKAINKDSINYSVEYDETTNIENNQLKRINNNEDIKNINYNDISNINNIKVENINNNENINNEKYNNSYDNIDNSDDKNLINIYNQEELIKQEYNNNYDINKINISSFSNNDIESPIFDSNYVTNHIDLKSMNNTIVDGDEDDNKGK